MIEPSLPDLSVGKQRALLSISRSSFYYEPKGESEIILDLMRVIDKQFLETPFYGVRQPLGTSLRDTLPGNGSTSSWSDSGS
jgi:putative transposase